MKTSLTRGIAIAALSSASVATSAADFSLNFNSLPSAQGWTYQSFNYNSGTSPVESLFYSVNGIALLQNTTGAGVTYANYYKSEAIDPSRPFTIIATAKVPSFETTGGSEGRATTVDFSAYAGSEAFTFSLNSNTIGINVGTASAIWLPFNSTGFHTYRIEALPGISSTIFIDDVLFYTSAPTATAIGNILYLGNASSYENGRAEITRYSFIQSAVPETATWLLMLSGLALVAVRPRRRA